MDQYLDFALDHDEELDTARLLPNGWLMVVENGVIFVDALGDVNLGFAEASTMVELMGNLDAGSDATGSVARSQPFLATADRTAEELVAANAIGACGRCLLRFSWWPRCRSR